MKLLVRMVDDDGILIGSQSETMFEPTHIEDRGIETVYRFEIEYHKLNEAFMHYYLMKPKDEEIGKDILTAMQESADAVRNSPHYDFSCVTELLDKEVNE